MSAITPQEAADWLEEHWLSEGVQLTHIDVTAIRILIDHARAAAPEGGDLAERVGPYPDAREGLWKRVHRLTERWGWFPADQRATEIVEAVQAAGWSPAPSVAAPPREDERENLHRRLVEAFENSRVTRAIDWQAEEYSTEYEYADEGEAHRMADVALTVFSPAPGTVRDPERAT